MEIVVVTLAVVLIGGVGYMVYRAKNSKASGSTSSGETKKDLKVK